MSADTVALILLWASAPPATLLVLIYGVTLPWWRSLIGRALMTSWFGLACVIDVSLLYRLFGADYQARDFLRLSAFAVVAVGAWLNLGVFLAERRRASKADR